MFSHSSRTVLCIGDILVWLKKNRLKMEEKVLIIAISAIYVEQSINNLN